MAFRETFYNVKQLMVNRLIDFGLEDADIDMGWTTLLTLSQNTRITIDVPLNLTYSDDFNITGTLETATYRRLSYKTLKLKVGNTIVATTETNVDGTYSFTTSPVSIGNHSFQVIFEGENVYNASESSIVNRVIGKETSVINTETTPTAHFNGSTIITGTLESDDAELIEGATIKLDTPSGTTLTGTTNQYGQFSFTVTDISSFNGVYADCYFEGDNYYAESSIRIPIPVYQETLTLTSDKDILSYADEEYATLSVQYKDTGDMNLGSGKQIDIYQIYEVDGINLSSDKDILSYADNEYATLTAQLIGNNAPSGELISFEVRKQNPSVNDTFEINNDNCESFFINPVTLNSDIIELDFSNVNDFGGVIFNYEDNTLTVEYNGSTDTLTFLEYDENNDEYLSRTLDNTDTVTIDNENKLILYNNNQDSLQNGYTTIVNSSVGFGETISVTSSDGLIELLAAETDSTGVATVSYYGKGSGELYIKAVYGLLIQTYDNIIDYYFNDDATTDNRSKYDTTHMHLPLSYDSVNKYYYITNTNSNDGYHNYLIIDDLNVPRGVEICFDVNTSTSYSSLHEVLSGCGLYNVTNKGLIGFGGRNHSRGYQRQATTDFSTETVLNQTPTINYSHENWYTIKYQITNNTMKLLIYQGDTLITSEELTNSYITLDANQAMFFFTCFNGTVRFKNLKVKAL